jgi:hypothetical protein
MTNIKDLTTAQLKRIIDIKQQIEDLENRLESIDGDGAAPIKRGPGRPKGIGPVKTKGKRKMSAAGRAKIAAAAKARWAKYRGEKPVKVEKPKRKMSAAWRAKIAASARARWKKAKAAGKKTL